MDYPGLEQYVWGTLTDKAFDYANYTAPGENKKPDNPDEPNNPDQPNKPDEPNTPDTPDNNSAIPTGKVVFKKVMSVNDLQPGGYYLIVNEKATAALGATNKGYRTSVTAPMSRFEMTAEVNGKDQPRTLTLGGKQGSYTLFITTIINHALHAIRVRARNKLCSCLWPMSLPILLIFHKLKR